MKVIVIAGAAHGLLASLGQLFGETAIAWEDASEGYKQGIVAGVTAYLENLELTPEQEHQKWLDAKLADGWVHGEAIDTTPKTHPLLLPFAELPLEHRVKATILYAAVHALKDLPDVDEAVAAAVAEALAKVPSGQPAVALPAASLLAGQVAVQYIGRKPVYADHLYGTGLNFEHGQVRNLPANVAQKFLRHGDMFAEAELSEVATTAEAPSDQQDDTDQQLEEARRREALEQEKQNRLHDLRQQIGNMNKDALAEYAMNNYRQSLDKRASVGTLRQQVIGMVDQYGQV